MSIQKEDIEKVAELSRLALTPEEVESYRIELGNIIAYVEQLDEVDTDGIEETNQVTGLNQVVREDVVIACDENVRKNIVNQFPRKRAGLLEVPAIFE